MCASTKESCTQESRIHLQQQWMDQKEMTLSRESPDPFKFGTSFSTWLSTGQCRPVQSSWKSSPQPLGLPAMRTAFETNMGVMTHQGKHGLLGTSEDRLWTESWVSRKAADSFTWIKLGLSHLRNLGWVRWVVFQGEVHGIAKLEVHGIVYARALNASLMVLDPNLDFRKVLK